ncbi:hypothetical protein PG996_003200 [Apiospora saccharicola]|uniref:Peptidase S8/S53 domain-containing protein n=1 Tax=Apiospora saccharicola TaxID=335842 RepID=A0ABR1W3H7_9PEZI
MGDFVPQSLTKPDNGLIAVGSTFDDGKFYRGTTVVGPGFGHNGPEGSMTVWAQGVAVSSLRPNQVERLATGSSFAAPLVAGLIANFMSEDPDQFQRKPGCTEQDGVDLVMSIKKHLVDLSYDRHLPRDHVPTSGEPLSYPVPNPINVAYNGAWGPQISCGELSGPIPSSSSSSSSSKESSVTISSTTASSVPSMFRRQESLTSTITNPDDDLGDHSGFVYAATRKSDVFDIDYRLEGNLDSHDHQNASPDLSRFHSPPAPTIVPNGACKNPPTCDQCIDGFQFRCRPNPNGDGGQVCWCEWESGCVGEYRYGDCATLDCTVYPFGGPRQSFHCDTTFNDGEYTGMYPDGLCYCRDTPCRAEKCPDLNCTATHGYGWQAVCDPSMEEPTAIGKVTPTGARQSTSGVMMVKRRYANMATIPSLTNIANVSILNNEDSDNSALVPPVKE